MWKVLPPGTTENMSMAQNLALTALVIFGTLGIGISAVIVYVEVADRLRAAVSEMVKAEKLSDS